MCRTSACCPTSRMKSAAARYTINHAARRWPSSVARYRQYPSARSRGETVARGMAGRACRSETLAAPASDGLDTDEGFAFLHELAVLGQDRRHSAAHLRLDLVEDLHRLQDADHLARLDHVANLDEGRRAGRGGQVEDAGERGDDGHARRGRRC